MIVKTAKFSHNEKKYYHKIPYLVVFLHNKTFHSILSKRTSDACRNIDNSHKWKVTKQYIPYDFISVIFKHN